MNLDGIKIKILRLQIDSRIFPPWIAAIYVKGVQTKTVGFDAWERAIEFAVSGKIWTVGFDAWERAIEFAVSGKIWTV